MKMNVILNVFSCSAQAPCSKWTEKYFPENTISLVVPNPFSQKAIQWARTGDLFAAALKELRPDLKDIEIDKRILTTFSVGWVFAHELFNFPKELERLDAYLLLDGCHTTILNKWIEYAKKAVVGKSILLMTHSSITPPFISSTKSNTQIMDGAKKEVACKNLIVPDFVLNLDLEKPITINLGSAGTKGTSQYLPAISKTWKKDPLLNVDIYGNLAKLHYSGNDRPDHVYIAWYTSEKMWKWLGSLLNPVIIKEEPVEIPTELPPTKCPQEEDEPKITDSSDDVTEIKIEEESKAMIVKQDDFITIIIRSIISFFIAFFSIFKK